MVMKIKPIKTLANEIASLYTIPIPLLDIAEDEGISVIYDDYGTDTFDGITWYEPQLDTFYIHVNTERGNFRDCLKWRFTLAHELGHYFIDHHRHAMEKGLMQPHIHCYNPFGRNENWEIEREADEFAANLLMPSAQFLDDFRGQTLSGQLIRSVSEKYKVSFSACAIRYRRLNFVPVMLVYSQNGKVKWQMRSPDFPFHRLRYGVGKVPENTVMGDYFYQGDSSCCNQDEIVYAGDCFQTYREEQNKLEFLEYCIGYKNNTFSVLWEK